ncbi:hypothetical protein FSP39_015924 [Pinctada imbricata]|uniref:RING-type domain-containing protein n=1 Tax=Pinctada imbricata TaxID=66713 RepID=A0AA88Y457_PINIB|nr:hypothetical protein FSP39_015924 [Pinctada imbricata]
MSSLASHFDQLSIDNQSTENSTDNSYNFELLRLLSFKDWPRESPIFPLRLAETGFWYLKIGDLVQCYFCRIQKQNWQKGDNPRKVHELLKPNCPFIQNPGGTNNIAVNRDQVSDLSASFNRITSLLSSGEGEVSRQESRESQTNREQQPAENNEHRSLPVPQSPRSYHSVPGRISEPITPGNRMAESNKTPQQFRLALNNDDESSSLPARLSAGNLTVNPTPKPKPLKLEDDPGILRFERNRLETFKNWPSNAPVSSKDLAKSGFYYTGTEDRVQCVFCRGILRDWDPGDKPHIEHKNKFPRCPFLLGVDVGNVQHTPAQPANQYQPVYRGGDFVNQPQNNMEALGISTDRPKHPNYAVESSRITSFRGWPQYKHQTPEQLAKAGFFYAGFGDNVKCFFCDGGLRNWEPGDDPWTEHARWFPKCNYVRNVRGEQYIRTIQSKYNSRQTSTYQIEQREIRARMELPMVRTVLDMGMNRTTVMKAIEMRLRETGDDFPNAQELLNAVLNLEESPEAMNVEAQEEPSDDQLGSPTAGPSSGTPFSSNQALEEENRKLKEQKTCKICMDEDVGVVFLPCGHLCSCVNCAPAIVHCPICRTPIKGSVRTYIP